MSRTNAASSGLSSFRSAGRGLLTKYAINGESIQTTKSVPITGSPFNLTTTTCVQTQGAQCILAPNPAYLSAEALKLAVEILDGKKPAEKKILLRNAFLTTDPVPSELYPDATMQKIEVGKNAFPEMAPGLFLPVSPDWVEITPAEAAGSK